MDDVIDAGGDNDFGSARKFKLSRFVQAGVKKFRYTYDMGDNWEHFIQVEKVLEIDPQAKYPRCVRHEEMLEWRGPFDPEAFDIEAVNRELATVR